MGFPGAEHARALLDSDDGRGTEGPARVGVEFHGAFLTPSAGHVADIEASEAFDTASVRTEFSEDFGYVVYV